MDKPSQKPDGDRALRLKFPSAGMDCQFRSNPMLSVDKGKIKCNQCPLVYTLYSQRMKVRLFLPLKIRSSLCVGEQVHLRLFSLVICDSFPV
uniref:Uncharacterized protein n=1 Tax=Anguilla anguilla TaxID=7936 RepID=A0A0E9X4Z4_ANGAN